MRRRIIVSIDSLIAMFRDYTATTGDIPPDTQALSLQVNPSQKGMFRILAESESWTTGLPPLRIDFNIKRVHTV